MKRLKNVENERLEQYLSGKFQTVESRVSKLEFQDTTLNNWVLQVSKISNNKIFKQPIHLS